LFTDKLVETARELVSNFKSIHPELGIASTPGRDVQVPTSVNRALEQILRSIDQGADKGELVPRIIEQLVQTSPVEKRAAGGTTNFFGGPSSGPRQTWTNQIANQVVEPLQLFYPRSLHDSTDKQSIAAILSRALATGCAVKAAGSGHSYSDVATTPDFLINTHGFCRVASEPSPIAGQLSPSALRSPLPLSLGPLSWPTYDPENNHALIEMEAGITIHDLNKTLEQRDLGRMNMGGYDGQSIIGATSTSTHGSGITLPPFPDMVCSLVLATTGRWNGPTAGGKEPTDRVYFHRIEPKNGITDPAKYKDPLVQLIQDDDCFYSAICSMQIGQRARQQGEQYQTSPFALRFVKASGANLSMMNGRNTAMIEMDMLTGTYAGPEVMYRYETRMYSLGGRPHWGLDFDCITGNNDLLRKMYTKLDNWLGVYRQFNALGTFNSSFTDRVGFTAFE
jgi:hypothetical protein